MHEMSIVQSLISIVEEEMIKNSAITLRSVRVKIGEMSGIVSEAMSTCFEILIENSDMKGAVLNIDIEPLIGYCRKCKNEFRI
ncbi:MAG: hydrogenase maturation nickel metallochaperone HypA, partial [Deltaproteobacteria bacterium]|nr:hydrogenase maturation nickel metallochaperone HypA [Deltaproteobacteria bacterium]